MMNFEIWNDDSVIQSVEFFHVSNNLVWVIEESLRRSYRMLPCVLYRELFPKMIEVEHLRIDLSW